MKPWIKEGLTDGTKIFAIFMGINIAWALILFIFQHFEINPGYGLLAFFTLAIYGGSLAVAKTKAEAILKEDSEDEA